MDAGQQSGPSWWMISGMMVGLGALCIGIGFIVMAMAVLAPSGSNTNHYLAAFYALVGVGIAFIGLSWFPARMAPRIK